MTAREQQKLEGLSERTARMEEKQESMAEDIKDIKEILKAQDAKFSKFVDASERKFITRLEGLAVVAFLSVAATLIVIYANIKDKL
jgi:Fic family protein